MSTSPLPGLVDVVEDGFYAVLYDPGAVLDVVGALEIGQDGLYAALDSL